MTERKRSTSAQGLRIFLVITLANSLRTCTLTTPPDARLLRASCCFGPAMNA